MRSEAIKALEMAMTKSLIVRKRALFWFLVSLPQCSVWKIREVARIYSENVRGERSSNWKGLGVHANFRNNLMASKYAEEQRKKKCAMVTSQLSGNIWWRKSPFGMIWSKAIFSLFMNDDGWCFIIIYWLCQASGFLFSLSFSVGSLTEYLCTHWKINVGLFWLENLKPIFEFFQNFL